MNQIRISLFFSLLLGLCFNNLVFAKPQESILDLARYGKYADVAKAIKKGANLEERNTYGLTPLMMAMNNKDLKVVELLIESGADVNAQTSQGWTSLFYAVEKTRDDIVPIIELLIKSGSDLEHKISSGQTPLAYAAEINGNTSIHRKLIELGANIESRNIIGITPLVYAAGYNTKEVFSFLLSKGADITVLNNKGRNILFYAVSNKKESSIEITKEIIATNKIDINYVDESGVNVLMYCIASTAKISILKVLIENGININAQEKNGITALMASCIMLKKTDVIDLLLVAGADINLTSIENKKARDYILLNNYLKDSDIFSRL